ncbi:hypothetical protein MLD38_040181 [Melastoma candidum]|uniref:Uncharacterized protein n=1 Tax=Melastoma candidum TaxID=119954 RepID=A0ACB9L4X2_9MYRT|nr:hypothetical protein MLD38_040181 [Melastoma candidum]
MTTRPPQPVRVLTRPPAPSAAPPLPKPAAAAAPSPSPPQPQTPHQNVVVVGFVSRRPDPAVQLINRVLDSHAFGSGRLDRPMIVDGAEVSGDWFRERRISYYYEEERGLLYLLFCSTKCPVFGDGPVEAGLGSGFDSIAEEREFGELQGMMFMFTVCHILLYIKEGSRFETQALKDFRVLQAAKNSLSPSVRSRTTPPLPSRPHSSSPSKPTVHGASSKNVSPGKNATGNWNNAPSVSLMSGLGSYSSSFPGQCTPVLLFVFLDDYMGLEGSTPSADEKLDGSSLSTSTSISSLTKSALTARGSGSVVMLSRPASKAEGGSKKKLQSSLETQIRFLIKKCRTLSGSDGTHGTPRGAAASSSTPLFLLDASRAVVLLDRATCQRGESLDFAINLVEDVLNGKETPDSLLLESHSQSGNKEDITVIREFIHRQSDVLRGRGGLVANANSGSAGGVGMVAVAAAAAAASAASGKSNVTLKLPNLESWLSSSKAVLNGIITGKRGSVEEVELNRRKPQQRNASPPQVDSVASTGLEPVDIAISWLERGKGLNTKFSTLWCQRALPAAKEVYLKDLPACYSTSQHETHLAMALRTFRSMVKGPSVQHFVQVLEDECISIWNSGRQLCDAVSLTGKPCMHQRHNADGGGIHSSDAESHSSGYFFLHACACGRMRRLRADPFDFQSANMANFFSDCEKLLPALRLPEIETNGPIKQSSWSLVRLGSSSYYDPNKGLLQSGFSGNQKFLTKWVINLENQRIVDGGLSLKSTQMVQTSDGMHRSSSDVGVESNASTDRKTNIGNVQGGSGDQQPEEHLLIDKRVIRFGKFIPGFPMNRPFSEVVAGSTAAGAGFPPLPPAKQAPLVPNNLARESVNGMAELVPNHTDSKVAEKLPDVSNGFHVGHPFFRIGNNIVPVNAAGEKMASIVSVKNVTVYFGFEHECPRGHRFLLNPKHLSELGSSYSSNNMSELSSSDATPDSSQAETARPVDIGSRVKVQSGNNASAFSRKKGRNMNRSKEMMANANGNVSHDAMLRYHNHIDSPGERLQSVSLDDGAHSLSLLDRDLPIYMSCPHCIYSNKKDTSEVKFASSISQLQRIFLVTPPFPVVFATNPIIQFEASYLPSSVVEREHKLQYTLGCGVILPPESFLVLRLPFVYGVQVNDQEVISLNPFEHQPERTAWIRKGSSLVVTANESGPE